MARHRQQRYISLIVESFRSDEFKTFFKPNKCVKFVMWICEICNEELVVGIMERTGSGGSPQKPLQERILMLL